MKKLILSLSLLMLCLCLVPTAAALADERGCDRGCRQEICDQICTMDNVADCRVAILNRHAFVAVKTKGITTSTSNKKLVESIKTKVSEICSDITEIYVSTSVKAFTAVEDVNNRKELKELLKLFGVQFEDIAPRRGEYRKEGDKSPMPTASAKPPVKLPYRDGDKRDYKDIIPKPLNRA